MARLSVAEARELVLECVSTPLPAEPVELGDSLGRTLAQSVTAPQNMPPFAASAMDGFACNPSPAGSVLNVTGESRAGSPALAGPTAGEAIRISTGALAPEGVGVAPVETVELQDGGESIVLSSAVGLGDHVRAAGEDLPAGATALPAGTILGPSELAVAAACGAATLECTKRPRAVIVVTGDELVAAGGQLEPGQIFESNGVGLAALCSSIGAEVVDVIRAGDSFEATRSAFEQALAAADIVLASGGVSVGEHDHVRPALEALGVTERFGGVALKPGGPTWFGETDSGLPVFALPGNPASAFVCFRLFADPAIRSLLGSEPLPVRWTAELSEPVRRGAREHAVRVRLQPKPSGLPLAIPTGAQGSHRTTSMVGAWGVAFIPAGKGELEAGAPVEVEPLG